MIHVAYVFIQTCSTLGLQAKLDLIVRRCVLIGLDIPAEPTTGHIVSVLITKSGVQLSPTESHAAVLDFKRKLKTAFKHGPGELAVTDFPIDPRDLPQARFEVAYKDSPPVSPQAIPAIPISTAVVPLRRTASTLRQVQAAVTPCTQLANPNQSFDQSQLANAVAMFLAGQQNGPQQLLPNLQVYRRPQRAPVWHLTAPTTPALQDKQPPAGTPPTPEETPPDQRPPSSPSQLPALQDISKSTLTTPMFQIPKPLPPSEQSDVMMNAIANRSEANKKAKEAEEKEGKSKKGKTTKVKSKAMKKTPTPASSSSSGKHKTAKHAEQRPRPAAAGQTVFFAGGKIHRSDLKQAWRVFVRKGDRCDKVPAFCFDSLVKYKFVHDKSSCLL